MVEARKYISACNLNDSRIIEAQAQRNVGKLGEIWNDGEKSLLLPQGAHSPVPASILHAWLVRNFPYAPGSEIIATVVPAIRQEHYAGWKVVFPQPAVGERGIVHMLPKEINQHMNDIIHGMRKGDRRKLVKRVRRLVHKHNQWQKDFHAGK